MSAAERPRTVAFYLPQYHRVPENDQWWGDGFTEWTNTRRAKPLFDGHAQPRVPTELGYYDLTDLDVMRRQVDMAKSADVDAFCFYFYWFDGHRLLEGPVDRYRDAVLDLPYCLSWANESWTRRWDGKARDVLMPQTYEEGFADLVYADLSSHFGAPHYLRHNGRPVLWSIESTRSQTPVRWRDAGEPLLRATVIQVFTWSPPKPRAVSTLDTSGSTPSLNSPRWAPTR